MAIYSADSPAQSSSSLSDVDDDGDRTDFVAETSHPARWSLSATGHRPLDSSPRRSRPSAAAPVSHLPPELLIYVFRQLSTLRDLHTCLLVSRQWCECGVQLVWHKPHIRDERALRKLLRALERPEPSFTYSDFIRRLNFTLLHNDVSNHDLTRLVVCTKLERLNLINCRAVTDDSLVQLFSSTPDLIAVDLTGVIDATDNALLALSRTATKLQGLNISNSKRMTDKGIIAVSSSCHLLRRVKLASIEGVTDQAIASLAANCPKLLEIDLTRCPKITDAAIRDLWTSLADLRELKVSYCTSLTDAAHPAPPTPANPFGANPPEPIPPLILYHTFDHFRILELSGCTLLTDDAIAGIISHAPKIRSLSLAKCSLLSDAALESISKLGRYLHDVHLGHVNKITDVAVCQLVRSCTRLRYVDLACCNKLTDMSVIELSQLPKLRRVGLVRVSKLTDQAIFALADRHATLERLHLSYCDNISIPAVHYLLQHLPKLMHLSLTGVPAFRTADLQRFCRQPPQEFTENQRAAFCVFSGKGVHELRAHLQDFMVQISDSARADTEDEDDDSGMMPPPVMSPLNAREVQMAFLNAPNAVIGNGSTSRPRPGARVTSNGVGSSSMTTPGASNVQLAGMNNGWGTNYATPASGPELIESLRHMQQRDHRAPTREGAPPIPFPDSGGLGLLLEDNVEESRGRRVQRSLRSTLNVAEHVALALFGRSSAGGGGRQAANGSTGR